jgi:hypothetical protein
MCLISICLYILVYELNKNGESLIVIIFSWESSKTKNGEGINESKANFGYLNSYSFEETWMREFPQIHSKTVFSARTILIIIMFIGDSSFW